jgi:hypothetical protein
MVGSGQKLSSWKEIAAYLHCDESTARRWERKARLPVYRVGGTRGSSVYAYTGEIEAWLRGKESQDLESTYSGLSDSLTAPETEQRKGTRFKSGLWKYGFSSGAAILALGITSLWWGPYRLTRGSLSKPTVASITPSVPTRRNLDQTIVVYGSDFQDGLTVTVYYPGGVGRLSGTQLQDINSSSFQMVVLLGIPGEYTIVVNNPDGTHSNRFSFQVKREAISMRSNGESVRASLAPLDYGYCPWDLRGRGRRGFSCDIAFISRKTGTFYNPNG